MRISMGARALAMSAVLVLGPAMAFSDGKPPPKHCPDIVKPIKHTCYHGASGNEVDCDRPGNHVVVDIALVFMQKKHGDKCVPDGKPMKTCDISRAKGQGATEPFEDVYCAPS